MTANLESLEMEFRHPCSIRETPYRAYRVIHELIARCRSYEAGLARTGLERAETGFKSIELSEAERSALLVEIALESKLEPLNAQPA